MADAKTSALTAVATPAGTDEFPVNQAGTSKKMTLAQIEAFIAAGLVLPAGSASAGSWPSIGSGTLLSTPESGAIERDADNLYFTKDTTIKRGIVPVDYIIRADGTRTFTSNTSAQAIFTSPANGRITLPVGLYLYDGILSFTGMSATSGNLKVDIKGGGTATLAGAIATVMGMDIASLTVSAVGGSHDQTGTSLSSPASAVTASTATTLVVRVAGTFEVSSQGTLIPTITMVTASAAVLAIGSYIKFSKYGNQSVVSVGPWD